MLRPISDRPFFADARPTPGTPEARSQVSGSFLFAEAQAFDDRIPDNEGGRPSCMPAASHLRASAAQRSRREGHNSSALWPLGQFVRKILPVSSGRHITHLGQPDSFGHMSLKVLEEIGPPLWISCGNIVDYRPDAGAGPRRTLPFRSKCGVLTLPASASAATDADAAIGRSDLRSWSALSF